MIDVLSFTPSRCVQFTRKVVGKFKMNLPEVCKSNYFSFHFIVYSYKTDGSIKRHYLFSIFYRGLKFFISPLFVVLDGMKARPKLVHSPSDSLLDKRRRPDQLRQFDILSRIHISCFDRHLM